MSRYYELVQLLQTHVKSGRPVNANIVFRDDDPEEFRDIFNGARNPAPPLRCADGFTMSVQASATHYCEPRNNQGPYFTFEIWRCYDELLEPYGDGNDPWAQVPLHVVIAIIEKHGGFAT